MNNWLCVDSFIYVTKGKKNLAIWNEMGPFLLPRHTPPPTLLLERVI